MDTILEWVPFIIIIILVVMVMIFGWTMYNIKKRKPEDIDMSYMDTLDKVVGKGVKDIRDSIGVGDVVDNTDISRDQLGFIAQELDAALPDSAYVSPTEEELTDTHREKTDLAYLLLTKLSSIKESPYMFNQLVSVMGNINYLELLDYMRPVDIKELSNGEYTIDDMNEILIELHEINLSGNKIDFNSLVVDMDNLIVTNKSDKDKLEYIVSSLTLTNDIDVTNVDEKEGEDNE